MLAQRNRLGLSEGTGRNGPALGQQFPQTYSMVGLVDAAMKLSRSWEEVV